MYYINAQNQIYQGDMALGDRPATQAEIDAHDISQAKTAKITEIATACKTASEANYTSNALGTVYTYPNKINLDQHNMNGQCTGALDNPAGTFYFPCADANGAWARRAHTAAQIRQVGQVARAQVETATLRYEARYNAIIAATTVAAVNAVIW